MSGDLDTTSATPTGRSRGRRLLGLVGFVAQRVVGDPVRAGRLRDTGWPPGLKAVVVVGLLLYALVMGLAVFGGDLRAVAELGYRAPSETFPLVALPVIIAAVVFIVSCLFTAALHLAWWLRPLVLLVVLAIVLRPLDLTQDHWTNLLFLAAAVALVLLMAARWTKPFHWGEFGVTLVIIGHAVVADVAFRNELYAGFATDLRLNSLSLIMLVMWGLATPAALLAGSAMAELTISAVSWTVAGVARSVLARTSAVVCLVLIGTAAVWRFVRSGWKVYGAEQPDPPLTFVVGVVMTLVLGGACLLVSRIPPAGGWGPPYGGNGPVEGTGPVEGNGPYEGNGPDGEMVATWSRATLPMALLLSACMVGTTQLREVLRVVGLGGLGDQIVNLGGSNQLWFLTALLAVSALLWAIRLARRGRRTEAVVWTAFGAMLATGTANTLIGLEAAVSGILTAVTVLVLGATAVLVRQGEWRSRSVVGLAALAVLAVAFEYREYIFEPVTALFTLTGVAAGLLVGLLWRLLTDNGFSHSDSPRFPRSSRVLLALANATMGVTAAAMVSLLGGYWELNLNLAEDAGDTILGSTLLFAIVFGALQAALRRR